MISAIIYFQLASCQIDSNLSGNRGISNNINESKERGVFLAEYTVNQNPYIINDSLKIDIEEAWLEASWSYGSKFSETIRKDKFRICIKVAPPFSLKEYDETWTIGDGYGGYFGQVSKKYDFLVRPFIDVPRKVEVFPVFKGSSWELRESEKKEIIGKLELIEKK